MLGFKPARRIVRGIGLRSVGEWNEWSKSGKRPSNIPGRPDKVYRDAGWTSWPDWMGYERVVNGSWNKGEYLLFKAARRIVRGIGLRSFGEWKEWSKSGKRPCNIPSLPSQVYQDVGWTSYPDWMGYEGKKKMKRAAKRAGDSGAASASSSSSASKKRRRAPSPSSSSSSSFSSEPAAKKQEVQIKVEEVDGFDILSADTELGQVGAGLVNREQRCEW